MWLSIMLRGVPAAVIRFLHAPLPPPEGTNQWRHSVPLMQIALDLPFDANACDAKANGSPLELHCACML